MTAEHKEALAAGRASGRAVRVYLEALESNKPRRGRRRSPENIERKLAEIDARIGTADPLQRLHLVQERRDLEEHLAVQDSESELPTLEAEFVKVAAEYGERKGISYATWREAGVPSDVLTRSGITRGRLT